MTVCMGVGCTFLASVQGCETGEKPQVEVQRVKHQQLLPGVNTEVTHPHRATRQTCEQ